jgi:hypothetical protein
VVEILRTAHVRMTSLRAASVHGLVFFFFYRKHTFLGTTVAQICQFAVNFVQVLADCHKVASELPQCHENLIFYFGILVFCIFFYFGWAQFSVEDLDLDQFGSGSFLVRSGSLKDYEDFQPQRQIGIRGVAKSARSEYLILHRWMP